MDRQVFSRRPAGLLGLPSDRRKRKVDLTAATETCEEIKQILPQFKIELLHGKMTPEDKTLSWIGLLRENKAFSFYNSD